MRLRSNNGFGLGTDEDEEHDGGEEGCDVEELVLMKRS